ncbi:MAG: glutamyl-tRNA reductase [Flavobacteriales bacterium]|nr:glutamyl-tRNA reductase [Flavobacteriales bacterium]
MKKFKIIAFTHKNLPLDEVGKFHFSEEDWKDRFTSLKDSLNISEIMYLSTCNRVEFLINSEEAVDDTLLHRFISELQPSWSSERIEAVAAGTMVYREQDALKHIFQVTASMDSMVVGEREIITQVRSAFEKCRDLGLTGDLIRLVIQHAVQTAKRIFTETHIADRPVSVVSLAYRRLREFQLNGSTRFLIIGAGQTIASMASYLNKHGYEHFSVFNRSKENAEKLAASLNGKAYSLSELQDFKEGFDVMITCTGATEPIVTENVYRDLLGDDEHQKVIIDLAIPHDVDPAINTRFNTKFIQVNHLKAVAAENLAEREKEVANGNLIIDHETDAFMQVLRSRRVELAMQQVPEKVKEIREHALNNVFARDLEGMDDKSKEVLDRMLSYMEKKYISVPMRMARDIILGNEA